MSEHPPRRIRLATTKGWRVGNISERWKVVRDHSLWGNPYIVVVQQDGPERRWRVKGIGDDLPDVPGLFDTKADAHTASVAAFERELHWAMVSAEQAPAPFRRMVEYLHHLKGRDLLCSCQLSWACHADVLLRAANPGVKFPPLRRAA